MDQRLNDREEASREGQCILGSMSTASRLKEVIIPSAQCWETRTGPWRPSSLAGPGPGQLALVVLLGEGGFWAIPRGPSPRLFSAICGSVICVHNYLYANDFYFFFKADNSYFAG